MNPLFKNFNVSSDRKLPKCHKILLYFIHTQLQNKIAATESFYNKVIPPPPDESFAIKIKEIDHFFADDDFKKATLYANDIFDVELGSDAISVNSVAFEVGGRPSKSHTSVSSKRLEKHTLNFEDVDNHARKVYCKAF